AALPSPHGHAPPELTAAAMRTASVDFPVPGAPAMTVSLPRAMRPGHSHSIGAACRTFERGGSSAAGARSPVPPCCSAVAQPRLARNAATCSGVGTMDFFCYGLGPGIVLLQRLRFKIRLA